MQIQERARSFRAWWIETVPHPWTAFIFRSIMSIILLKFLVDCLLAWQTGYFASLFFITVNMPMSDLPTRAYVLFGIVVTSWLFVEFFKRLPYRVKAILEYHEVLKPKEEAENHGETDS